MHKTKFLAWDRNQSNDFILSYSFQKSLSKHSYMTQRALSPLPKDENLQLPIPDFSVGGMAEDRHGPGRVTEACSGVFLVNLKVSHLFYAFQRRNYGPTFWKVLKTFALFRTQKDKFLSNLFMEVHTAKKKQTGFLNKYGSNHNFLWCTQKMVQLLWRDCGHNLLVSSELYGGKVIPCPVQECHAPVSSFPDHSL